MAATVMLGHMNVLFAAISPRQQCAALKRQCMAVLPGYLGVCLWSHSHDTLPMGCPGHLETNAVPL